MALAGMVRRVSLFGGGKKYASSGLGYVGGGGCSGLK